MTRQSLFGPCLCSLAVVIVVGRAWGWGGVWLVMAAVVVLVAIRRHVVPVVCDAGGDHPLSPSWVPYRTLE